MTEKLIILGLDEEERETEDSLFDALIELFVTEMSLDLCQIQIVKWHKTGNGAKQLDRGMLLFASPLTTIR